MEQQLNFRIVKTWDDKTQFINNNITIAVEPFSYNNGKHKIDKPMTANAQFVCGGKLHMVTNAKGIATVEDWYLEELLPKMQMLNLLTAPVAIEKTAAPEILCEKE